MSLRVLAQILVILTATALVAVVMRLTVIDHLLQFEARQARTGIERAIGGVAQESERIGSLAGDWSLWDDSYRHALGENPAFVNEVNQVILKANRLSLIAIASTRGQVVTVQGQIAGEAASFANLAREISGGFRPLADLPELTSHQHQLVSTEHGTLLACGYPLRTGDGEGPAAGTLIMGRLLDPGFLTELSQRIGNHVDLHTDPDAARNLPATAAATITALPGGLLRVQQRLPIPGAPSIAVVVSNRDVVAGTLVAMAWAMVALLVIGLGSTALLRHLRAPAGQADPLPWMLVGAGLLLALLVVLVAWRTDTHEGSRVLQLIGLGGLIVGLLGVAVWAARTLHQERLRQRHEAQLTVAREQAAIQAALFTHLPLIAWRKDVQGRILAVNQAYALMMGRTDPESMIGTTDADFWPADQVRRFDASEHKVLESGQALRYRERLQTADGIRWYDIVKAPMRDPGQQIIGTIGFALDVTDTQAIEDERRLAAERVSLAAKAAAVGIWECSPATDSLVWDDQMVSLHGLLDAKEASTYADWLGLIHPDDRQAADACFAAFLRGENAFDTEFRIIRKRDGATRTIRSAAIALRDHDGAPRRVVGANWDVTVERAHAASLAKAMHEAKAADQAKSEFLATMSHEIRTPLNGILGTTAIILEGPLSPPQREMAELAKSSGESLLALINDILDLSKIEAERMELERIWFHLPDLVDDTVIALAAKAHEKNLRCFVHIHPTRFPMRLGDPVRMRQILLNLVGNAIKFTQAGRVVVEVTATSQDQIRIAVRDTGIGIPDDRVSLLFQPFSQVDSSMARRFGGTGLGLAIVKRLISLMDGTVALDTRDQEGSTFTITIPMSGEPAVETASYPLRIRIHDPDPESQAGLASQVVAAGGTVVVDDPADAMIWDVRAGVPPTDLGPALVVAIPIGGQVPLLPDGATTLTLPATGTRLRAILRGIHRGRMSDTHPIIRAPVAVTTGIRILVAEDNPVNQRVAQAMLERLGHQVTVVADGAAAVAILSDQDFDLVLMDCQMPGMDGLEATRQIRLGANVRNPRIQIIALTANAMVGDRERCLEAGMNDYTPKPVTLASLREAITRSILRNVIR